VEKSLEDLTNILGRKTFLVLEATSNLLHEWKGRRQKTSTEKVSRRTIQYTLYFRPIPYNKESIK